MNDKINTRKRLMTFICSLFLVAEALIYIQVYLVNCLDTFDKRTIYLYVYCYALVFFVLVMNRKVYNVGNIRLLDAFFAHIVIAIGSMLVITIGIIINEGSFEGIKIWTQILIVMMQMAFGAAVSYFLHQVYMHFVPKRRLLAVINDNGNDTVLENKRYNNAYYEVADVIYYSKGEEAIFEKAREYDGILVGELEVQARNNIVRRCFYNETQVFYMLKIADELVGNSKKYVIYDQIYFMNSNKGLHFGQRVTKRLMDIVVSFILLLLLSPICFIIMLLIKIEDKGPIFYKQERLTIGGKSFDILKFRSMKADKNEKREAEPAPTMQNDDRITKVGRVIRNLHFDEIPQLINVLKGDMSIVGPRPERRIFTNVYSNEIREFECRLKVKAGITGYAQVYGKYNTNAYDKLKLDLYYITNYSLLMDIKLIILTIRILFQRETVTGLEYDEYLDTMKKVLDEKEKNKKN